MVRSAAGSGTSPMPSEAFAARRGWRSGHAAGHETQLRTSSGMSVPLPLRNGMVAPHPHAASAWMAACACDRKRDTATANGGVWPPRMIHERSSRAAPATGAHCAVCARRTAGTLRGPCGWTSSRGGCGGRICDPSCDRVVRYGHIAPHWRCAIQRSCLRVQSASN